MRIISPRIVMSAHGRTGYSIHLCLVLSSVLLILKTELDEIATWAVLEPRLLLSNQSYDL
jgi:hypothetical protein